MKIRPLAAEFSKRRQDVTVAFCNFGNVLENGYDRECSTHYIANVRGYTLNGIPKN